MSRLYNFDFEKVHLGSSEVDLLKKLENQLVYGDDLPEEYHSLDSYELVQPVFAIDHDGNQILEDGYPVFDFAFSISDKGKRFLVYQAKKEKKDMQEKRNFILALIGSVTGVLSFLWLIIETFFLF